MRVLVFPSSNEPGLEVIEALRRHPRIEVWGGSSFDIISDPSRLILADRHVALPVLGAPGFREDIRMFCVRNAIGYVFPTVDAVVAEMAGWQEDFRVIAPQADLAGLVLSKARVYEAVRGPVPVPEDFDPETMAFPAFTKPETGSGSRGAVRVDGPEALAAARKAGFLIQEYLPGREYTVDCVGDAAGKLLACSVRQRLAYGGGIAKAATCVDHAEIEAYVHAISRKLPLAGPWFAQFREDVSGVPKLMEVNARVGGSSGVTRLAGINIPLLSVLSFSGMDVAAPMRRAVGTINRRLDLNGDIDDFDWVIWDLDDTLVHDEKIVDPEMVGWLYRFHQRGKRQTLLTRNPDPQEVMSRVKLPDFFDRVIKTDDKIRAVEALSGQGSPTADRIVMINDSGAEKIAFERVFPQIRTIAPDAMGVLCK